MVVGRMSLGKENGRGVESDSVEMLVRVILD